MANDDCPDDFRTSKLKKLSSLRDSIAKAAKLNQEALINHHYEMQKRSMSRFEERRAKASEKAEKRVKELETRKKRYEEIRRREKLSDGLDPNLDQEEISDEKFTDYERLENLLKTAEQIEYEKRKDEEKSKKRNTEFVDYADANLKKHEKLVRKNLEGVNGAKYSKQNLTKEQEIALEFKKSNQTKPTNSVDLFSINVPDDDPDAIVRMSEDIKSQHLTRSKHSRKRRADESIITGTTGVQGSSGSGDGVGYINEKNRKFNKKVGRAYDKYTEEIRESLERGTAL